jgi:aldehyde:ferredoxin oxidoreductase
MDTFSLGYAVSPNGANHLDTYSFLFESIDLENEGGPAYAASKEADPTIGMPYKVPRWSIEGIGKAVALGQELRTFVSSLAICAMGMFNVKFADYCSAYRYATGSNQKNQDILKVLEAITNLRRCFNIKCGLGTKHDYLPRRLLTLPRNRSQSKNHVPKLEPMIEEYYKHRNWDLESGKPRKEKLIEIGLKDVAKQLYENTM